MEKMKKKINLEKKIIIAETIFVFGILAYLFFSTAPTQLYPLHGMTITEPDFVFEIEDGEEVVISTHENFESEIILGEGSDVILPPGTYYWKVRGMIRESKVRMFTIQSHAGLDLREGEEQNTLDNSGNVDLNVSKEKEGFVTSFSIDVGSSEDVEKDDSNYEGRQE